MAIIEKSINGAATKYRQEEYKSGTGYVWGAWKDYSSQTVEIGAVKKLQVLVEFPQGGEISQVSVNVYMAGGPSMGKYVYLLDDWTVDPDHLDQFALGKKYISGTSETVSFDISPTQNNIFLIVLYPTTSGRGKVDTPKAIATGDDTAPVVSLISPEDTVLQYGNPVRYEWDLTYLAGYQLTENILEYSYDNSTWNNIINYGSNPVTSYTDNTKRAAGKIYWRVRAKTAFSDYGEDNASYDIIYVPSSVTLTAPTSGTRYGDQGISFQWSITQGSGSIQGTQLEYSADNGTNWTPLLNASGSRTSYIASAKTLPIGEIMWRVRVNDQYTGWTAWEYASFTVLESIPVTSASAPKNQYVDRTASATFAWTTTVAYGSITGAELEYDLDDGQGWRALGTVTGAATEYTVPADTFPALSSIVWRVRAKNGDNAYGLWSSASFATIDAVSNAIPKQPDSGAGRDETAEIFLYFSVTNELGSAPKGGRMQYRVQDGDWVDLFDEPHVEQWDGTDITQTTYGYQADPNTFPGAVIYWRVRVYNQDGVAGEWSKEAYFSTIDAPSVSTPISPTGTIEDTDSDLVFRWSTSSTSGTAPTGADLRYSYDGISWLELGHTDGTKQLTVSGGIIHAGTVQWQVRSYNRNGTAGAWSASATFVARAAPKVLEVTADGKPFTVITWQATDQQCYEIEIDGSILYGSFFGEEKNFQLPNYLDDGVHTVKVRVQNEMNIWSKPGELTFTVLNIPGGALYLSGDFDLDAELFWEDETDGSDYLIYRDGTLIGESAHKRFNDRVVLGEHTYYVVKRFADGYFSRSNDVECTLRTDITQVSLLAGGEWMSLEKSENAKRTQRFTHSLSVSYHHFSGDKNPTPEIGDEETLVAEFDAAWFYTEEGRKKLRALLGQALIIKSRGDEVVIGILEAYTKVNRKHFCGYAFSIHQMEWKDYVCAE